MTIHFLFHARLGNCILENFATGALTKGDFEIFSLKSTQEQEGIQLAELPLQAKMHNLYKNK